MTIQECYKEMGGDFEGVQKRFGGAAMVKKFAIKFLSDSSFQDPVSYTHLVAVDPAPAICRPGVVTVVVPPAGSIVTSSIFPASCHRRESGGEGEKTSC